MNNDTKKDEITITRTVYKSGKVCYIAKYKELEETLILHLEYMEDLREYDEFASRELRKKIMLKRKL